MANPVFVRHYSVMLIKVAIVEDNVGVRENWAKMIDAAARVPLCGKFPFGRGSIAGDSFTRA